MTWKRELLETEDRVWRDLSARLDRLTEDDWNRSGAAGDWTPKDVLAHVACWHAEVAAFLERRRMGDRTPLDLGEVDEYNRNAYERCRELSLREVKAMSGAARHRFREEVAAHADEISDPRREFVAGSAHPHYEEHIPLLDAFLAQVRA